MMLAVFIFYGIHSDADLELLVKGFGESFVTEKTILVDRTRGSCISNSQAVGCHPELSSWFQRLTPNLFLCV